MFEVAFHPYRLELAGTHSPIDIALASIGGPRQLGASEQHFRILQTAAGNNRLNLMQPKDFSAGGGLKFLHGEDIPVFPSMPPSTPLGAGNRQFAINLKDFPATGKQ